MDAHAPNLIDEDQYRKEVLLLPSEESEISRNQKLLDEAHQLGLKVSEIEVTASLTASIASGMVDLNSSPVLSSGSSTSRNSVCERPGTAHQQPQQQQQQQGQQQRQQPHQHHEIPVDQIASNLSELTVSSRPVKSGSVRSIASLSTRPTSYCSSDGKLAGGGPSDGVTAKPASAAMYHNNRHSMISMTPGEKKEKRRASLKSAIDKFPFRRKRTSSAVLLPPETQITITKGEQGENRVYVESKLNESQSQSQLQPTSASNNEENSVMKLEIPIFDHESLQRSLVNAELVKMREAHRLERNRHVAFQSAFTTRLRSRQQASVADRLAENKRLEDEKREKNAANATRMEERQLAVEMEQQREFDRAKQNARTRIKHMEGYFNNRSPPSSPGSGSDIPAQPRQYTSQQKAQLAQEYHDHETMDQLHKAKIKVLRERQERRLQEAIERMENELDAMIDKHAEGFSELQKQHQQEESTISQGFDARKKKLMHRWNLEEAVLRRKLEQQHGQPYGPLPPLTFNDSHYETRDSACCVGGSGDDEQMHQKGDGNMI